jgi:hypothetical protein
VGSHQHEQAGGDVVVALDAGVRERMRAPDALEVGPEDLVEPVGPAEQMGLLGDLDHAIAHAAHEPSVALDDHRLCARVVVIMDRDADQPVGCPAADLERDVERGGVVDPAPVSSPG